MVCPNRGESRIIKKEKSQWKRFIENEQVYVEYKWNSIYKPKKERKKRSCFKTT